MWELLDGLETSAPEPVPVILGGQGMNLDLSAWPTGDGIVSTLAREPQGRPKQTSKHD